MKRLWLFLIIMLCVPCVSYAQQINLGEGVGSSIGDATLSLVNASEAVSNIKLTTGNYSISGKVTDKKNNKPLAGVLVNLSDNITTATYTDSKGRYAFSYLDSGDYTVTPTLEGYEFKPNFRDVTITTVDQSKVNFKARKVKSSLLKENVSITSSPMLYIQKDVVTSGWPYGEPDAEGYYSTNGYKMRFYDASDNVITDMATKYASAIKLEVEVQASYDNGGSVDGSIFANTSVSTSGPSFPLVFNGTLKLAMSSSEYGVINGTVEILDCEVASDEEEFFSSGSMVVNTVGSITAEGFTVTHSTSGTLNVTGDAFQGTLSLTYNVVGSPVPVSATVPMTLTVNADGHGSYSTDDPYVGSGTF